MTGFSNTRQDFREHVRSFRNVPGISCTYQVFGAHILMLGTPLTLSIKVTCKYRNRVIICRKWSIINCVHIWQGFLTQDRIFENMPGLSGTYQVFRAHTRCLVHQRCSARTHVTSDVMCSKRLAFSHTHLVKAVSVSTIGVNISIDVPICKL